jgi:hypothetical protein
MALYDLVRVGVGDRVGVGEVVLERVCVREGLCEGVLERVDVFDDVLDGVPL